MSTARIHFLLLLGAVCGGLVATARAQSNSPSANVLMQLMQSQLPVDISSPVAVKTEMDPPIFDVGEKGIYRVTLNALEASVHWPSRLPLPGGLQVMPAARGQILPAPGGITRAETTLNFHVRGERQGFYTIPAFFIEVYGKPVRVPETHFEIGPRMEAGIERARQLLLRPLRTNVFVGESFRVRVLAPATGSNVLESLAQLQFGGDGFFEDKFILRQQIERVEVDGRIVPAWMIESSVTAIGVGPQKLSAQAFTSGMKFLPSVRLQGPIASLSGQPQHVLLDSDPVIINVRPLPAAGTAKGFTGFVGKLAVDPPHLTTNSLRLGEVVTMRVTFRSENSLARLTPPPLPRVPGWQVFPPTPTETPPSAWPVMNNGAAFAYTLIPMTEDAKQTPAIPFQWFDPERAAYVELNIPPVEVTVTAGDLAAELKPANWSASDAQSNPRPVLSQLAALPGTTIATLVPLQLRPWFWLVQLALAIALAALWCWDRRRRFFESHPEFVLFRKARRALRLEQRALRQAATRGDASGFVRRAVAAMQIAAAPHFPATPRALVCGEVLSLFDAKEQGGRTGAVIRSFFTRDAATNYGEKPESAMPLFDLRPELERILKLMEARL